jgi:hypothetical protein
MTAGRGAWLLTAATVVLSVAVPAVELVILAGAQLAPNALSRYLMEMGNTMKYSIAGGLAAAGVALLALAWDAATVPGRGRRVLMAGGALALTAPGMAVAYTALLGQLHVGGTQTAWWWMGFLLLRCAPWCLPLIVWGGGGASARAALALGLSPGKRVRAALRERGLALGMAAMLAGAAGSMREYEYFAAFGLPNGESISARAAQMLHFGMRAPLASIMVVQLAVALVWSLVAMMLWRRRG